MSFSVSYEEKALSPFLDMIQSVYDEIDASYAAAAVHCGFQCSGCDDSCCSQLFSHYTLAEYLYLMKGFGTLAPERQGVIRERALDVMRRYEAGEEQVLCPLNQDGLCELYAYRPMICRMHGIPHMLRTREGAQQGEGCHRFVSPARTGLESVSLFDRTPHYQRMASVEIGLRRTVQYAERFKMTVAGMIVLMQTDAAKKEV